MEQREILRIELILQVARRNNLRWLRHVLRKDDGDWVRGDEVEVVRARGMSM